MKQKLLPRLQTTAILDIISEIITKMTQYFCLLIFLRAMLICMELV